MPLEEYRDNVKFLEEHFKNKQQNPPTNENGPGKQQKISTYSSVFG